jgi:hypothetical protein
MYKNLNRFSVLILLTFLQSETPNLSTRLWPLSYDPFYKTDTLLTNLDKSQFSLLKILSISCIFQLIPYNSLLVSNWKVTVSVKWKTAFHWRRGFKSSLTNRAGNHGHFLNKRSGRSTGWTCLFILRLTTTFYSVYTILLSSITPHLNLFPVSIQVS